MSGSIPGVRAVFLVGFMGAGKTSVGREVARRLGWPFEDLDDRIQRLAGRTIEQIFQESGEVSFRQLEHAALKALVGELGSSPSRVVALGGGAFAQDRNGELLNNAEFAVIFLDAPVEELFRRCQQQKLERPLRRDREQFRRLYEDRLPAYRKAGTQVETSGKSVEQVAEEVIRRLSR